MTMHELTKHLVDIPNSLNWIYFFLIFSRFEYALKRSGYSQGGEKSVKADWIKFGNDIKHVFEENICQELEDTISYLKESPPKQQVLKNGKLDWGCPKEGKGDIHSLINAVKRVRNNLFHGGKFPNPTGPVEDPTRDKELIKHSITVLKYLLCSSPEVERLYKEPLE